MPTTDPTYVGQVASVAGGVIRVKLRQDLPTTLVLVAGESYRVGQIGGFFRIPLGYAQLYAVCSQVGADAAPAPDRESERIERDDALSITSDGFKWMTIVLFGESVANVFERGVGQYPTVGDEVHFVTNRDLKVIYGTGVDGKDKAITLGTIASASGIMAKLDLSRLVTRHSAIVGSTGAGKSNLVSVMLEQFASNTFPASRVLVIDPHGEYGDVKPEMTSVFSISPAQGQRKLVVPFWAIPCDVLISITFGGMTPGNEAVVRDLIVEMKRDAASKMKNPPPPEKITADSPVPFSIKKLWFVLDDFERMTMVTGAGGEKVASAIVKNGDPNKLISNVYTPYSPGSREPMKNPSARAISKQLEFARGRITDSSYAFIYEPGDDFSPKLTGEVEKDLDDLVFEWIGSGTKLNILDVSELPSDIASDVVALLLRAVYDMLFWAESLSASGKNQPLLIVLDEAHRFLPDGPRSLCHEVVTKIAKEGRKYGVGLSIVTQRPSEIDATVLSQCGTMISLRTTNPGDRSRIGSCFPDDLGGLVDLLPSLRTGEALLVGEAMAVPSRVRISVSKSGLSRTDPNVFDLWSKDEWPDAGDYTKALSRWRVQSKS